MGTQSEENDFAGERPEVAPGTRFERRGFRSPEPEEEEPEAQAAAEETEGEPELDSPEHLASAVADPNDPEEPGTLEETASPEETIAPQAPKDGIVIGGRTFKTQKEAFAYAEELQRERETADAFRQGVEAASAQAAGNTPPQAEKPNTFEQDFYANPQEYLAKKEAEILARAEANFLARQEAEARKAATWNKFYSDHPDLENSRELVQHLLQRDWGTLQHIQTDKALGMLAKGVRELKQKMLSDMLPKQTLPAHKRTVSSGGGTGPTRVQEQEKALSFPEQFRKNKNRRMPSA